MSGAFSRFQPVYAEHGVPTFPVEIIEDGSGKNRKKPMLTHWRNVGLPGSAKLAAKPKFADIDLFGYHTGRQGGITVLDIDTTDEKVAEDAIRRHGKPRIITRTASGKQHLLYRYNHERRVIRPWQGRDIDLLGSGGFAIAAPSKVATDSYEIIHGHFDDLDRLTPMTGVDDFKVAARITASFPALTPTFERNARVPIGRRNDALLHHCLVHAPHCDTLEDLVDVAQTFYLRDCEREPAMTDAEIRGTALSAWTMQIEGRNWIQQRGRRVVFHHDDIDGLMRTDPDAFLLEAMLRRHHWNRDFVIANAMAESMPGGGWTLRRFRDARLVLLELGRIELARRAGRRTPAFYRWPETKRGIK